jgi:hypothetical protein
MGGVLAFESFANRGYPKNMDPSLPSYAGVIAVAVIFGNLATAWLLVLTMGENSGGLADAGPPWVVAISCLLLVLCYYRIIMPVEMSFWGSAIACALGLWGAWVDYTRLVDRRKAIVKSPNMR